MAKPVPATLRPADPGDHAFLVKLYASTRWAEFAALGWSGAQIESLLRMQFDAQRRWYKTAHARAEEQIVIVDGSPAGRIIVEREAGAMVLVDVSLLPQHRGRGIGSGLIRDLIAGCQRANLPLRLQVLKTNPAVRLYTRLGFFLTGEDGMYLRMEKTPL